jgi:hypothetical protein
MSVEPAKQSTRRWSAREVVAGLWWRLNNAAASMYVGAASLIGFEALALLLGFTTAWPIAIPILVGLLALLYFARPSSARRWRAVFSGR